MAFTVDMKELVCPNCGADLTEQNAIHHVETGDQDGRLEVRNGAVFYIAPADPYDPQIIEHSCNKCKEELIIDYDEHEWV